MFVFFKCFCLRKCLFKGKRLSIFDVKAFDDEAPEPGLLRREQHCSECGSSVFEKQSWCPGGITLDICVFIFLPVMVLDLAHE